MTTQDSTLHIADCRLASGLRLNYAQTGNPRGLPVILVHGYSDSWPSMLPLMRAMPPEWRVLALSQRGHGDSAKPDSGYDIADFSEDLLAFMNVLVIDQAVVLGHSLGSLVALNFAATHPQRVHALILLGAMMNTRDNEAVRALWEGTMQFASDPVDPHFVRDFQLGTLAQPVASAVVDNAVAESLKLPARVWRSICKGLTETDLRDAVSRIRLPTLIHWGDRDSISSRAEQLQLNRLIPGSELHICSGNGHAQHWEQPDKVAEDIHRWLTGAVVRAAA